MTLAAPGDSRLYCVFPHSSRPRFEAAVCVFISSQTNSGIISESRPAEEYRAAIIKGIEEGMLPASQSSLRMEHLGH